MWTQIEGQNSVALRTRMYIHSYTPLHTIYSTVVKSLLIRYMHPLAVFSNSGIGN